MGVTTKSLKSASPVDFSARSFKSASLDKRSMAKSTSAKALGVDEQPQFDAFPLFDGMKRSDGCVISPMEHAMHPAPPDIVEQPIYHPTKKDIITQLTKVDSPDSRSGVRSIDLRLGSG